MSDNLNTIGIRGKIAARTPDYRYTLPEGGNPGDIPVKTETGVEWQQPEPATTTPDYNQNDETASDYIKNRPGGYTVTQPAINIEWDGVIGDRVVVDVGKGTKFVKVSDEIPTKEQLIGATVKAIKNGSASGDMLSEGVLYENSMCVAIGDGLPFVIKEPGFMADGSTEFPETGVYFVYQSADIYWTSLSIPAKSAIVPIPGELTNIVGGYVRAEKKEPLVDAVIPASSFELYTGGK